MGKNNQNAAAASAMNDVELTLEQMNLDRKVDFEGDEFDPFNFGMGQKK